MWHPSIEEQQVLVVDVGDNWMTPIIRYLSKGILPAKDREAKKIIRKSVNYSFINEILYKRSFNKPWLRCISTDEGTYVLIKIYQGIYGAHKATDFLARKVALQGTFAHND